MPTPEPTDLCPTCGGALASAGPNDAGPFCACAPEERCLCGHFAEEHTEKGGCAGCDAGGQPVAVIMHAYRAVRP